MKITQIRNATIVIETQNRNILIDPMLAERSTLPRLRYFGSNRRNPLVALPSVFQEVENEIDIAMITHCQKGHFDHLDRAGISWLRENQITTYCSPRDNQYLQKKGIKTKYFKNTKNCFLGGSIHLIPAKHTSGWLTPFMEHGTGYYIQLPGEPSLYLMGDTILTDDIKLFITQHQPSYIVAPTGKAQLDIGAPLLMNDVEILELAALSTGRIIANHMDAIDHCRLGRSDLFDLLERNDVLSQFLIPKDGEVMVLNSTESPDSFN